MYTARWLVDNAKCVIEYTTITPYKASSYGDEGVSSHNTIDILKGARKLRKTLWPKGHSPLINLFCWYLITRQVTWPHSKIHLE